MTNSAIDPDQCGPGGHLWLHAAFPRWPLCAAGSRCHPPAGRGLTIARPPAGGRYVKKQAGCPALFRARGTSPRGAGVIFSHCFSRPIFPPAGQARRGGLQVAVWTAAIRRRFQIAVATCMPGTHQPCTAGAPCAFIAQEPESGWLKVRCEATPAPRGFTPRERKIVWLMCRQCRISLRRIGANPPCPPFWPKGGTKAAAIRRG